MPKTKEETRTRRREYMARRNAALRAAGTCTRCAAAPLFTAWLCAGCLAYRREYCRGKSGCRPWRPGGRGRKPLPLPPTTITED